MTGAVTLEATMIGIEMLDQAFKKPFQLVLVPREIKDSLALPWGLLQSLPKMARPRKMTQPTMETG